jgi:hypothetical protein
MSIFDKVFGEISLIELSMAIVEAVEPQGLEYKTWLDKGGRATPEQ